MGRDAKPLYAGRPDYGVDGPVAGAEAAGLAMFLLGTTLCGLAPTLGWLIFGRVMQGLGACAGDSGAPVFRDKDGRIVVIGVVSWSTGPKLGDGCGGLTGVTPLARYRAWILNTARMLGSPLAP